MTELLQGPLQKHSAKIISMSHFRSLKNSVQRQLIGHVYAYIYAGIPVRRQRRVFSYGLSFVPFQRPCSRSVEYEYMID
jgi:hypothetical protein